MNSRGATPPERMQLIAKYLTAVGPRAAKRSEIQKPLHFSREPRYIPPMSSVDIQEILKLSVPERIELVEAIWDSIAEVPETLPVTAAQKQELDRRLAEYQRNPQAGRTWEEFRDSLDEAE